MFNGYTLGRGQHMYEFFGSSDASVVIRPDLTMPIGRFLATTNIELPRKFYYLGDVLMKKSSIAAILTKLHKVVSKWSAMKVLMPS